MTSSVALAHGDSLDNLTLQPFDAGALDCGVPQQFAGSNVRFWNYDVGYTDCAQATAVLDGFLNAQEKYASVGEWQCAIRGAAEVDRTGILIRCVGSRGPFNALQVEQPL